MPPPGLPSVAALAVDDHGKRGGAALAPAAAARRLPPSPPPLPQTLPALPRRRHDARAPPRPPPTPSLLRRRRGRRSGDGGGFAAAAPQREESPSSGLGAALQDPPPGPVENGSFGGVTQEEQSTLYNFLYPSKELLPDDKMSIFDHLEELCERIFVSVLAVGAAIPGCFAFSRNSIVLLEAPVSVQGIRFLQLSPGEFSFTTLKVDL